MGTVYAGLLALRVRWLSLKSRSSGFLQTAFPGMFPVTGCDVLAYSCAAARELHPLPCLRHKAKTRKPKDISKNGKT